MTPHYADDAVTLYAGDCLDVLAELPDASIDAVVTDPPYGLGFMGKTWDSTFEAADMPMRRSGAQDAVNAGAARQGGRQRAGADYQKRMARDSRVFQDWCTEWAGECLRVLKPGGHLLSFGGSRTWHRLAAGIEDAGFEIRDSIAWLYGSGFPKSLDVSKAIDKAAGAEREVMGRTARPDGSTPRNGVGGRTQTPFVAHAIEGDSVVTAPATDAARQWAGWGTALKPAFEPIVVARKPLTGTVAANVLEHGTGALNIDATRVGDEVRHAAYTSLAPAHGNRLGAPGTQEARRGTQGEPKEYVGRWPTNVALDDTQADALDQQAGTRTSGVMRAGTKPKGERNTYGQDASSGYETAHDTPGDSGGASRFFPTFHYEPKAGTIERPREGDVAHPTVKPLDLMRWLIRLITPPGGTILDPFAGSGTTAEAAIIEHYKCITIERDETYLPLIVARLSKPIQIGLDYDQESP